MALQPILKIDRERVDSSIHAHEHYLKIPRAVPLPVCVRTCAFGLHLYRQTTEAHAHAGSLDIWNNAIVCVPVRRRAAALPIQADNLSACAKWHPLHTWTASRILLRNAWLTFYFCFSKLFIQYIKIIPFFYVVCNTRHYCQKIPQLPGTLGTWANSSPGSMFF